MSVEQEPQLDNAVAPNYNSFENLYTDFYDKVVKYLFFRGMDKDTASDTAQDVFETILRKWDSLPFVTPGLVYKIAAHKLIDHRRNLRTTKTVDFPEDEQGLGTNGLVPSAESSFENKDELDIFKLWELLQALTPEQEELMGFVAAGYKWREIAKTLGISIAATRSRIHRARQRLIKMRQEKGG